MATAWTANNRHAYRSRESRARPVETTRDREGTHPPRTLETAAGVEVIVRDPAPLAPQPAPAPPEQLPGVLIVPENQPPEDRAAFIASVCAEHAKFILDVLLRRRDLQAASAEDVGQRVLLVLRKHLDEHVDRERPAPEAVQAFLRGVIRKEVGNHTRGRRRGLPQGADAEGVVCAALDPERAVALAEHRAKVARYIGMLSKVEAEVVRAIDLEDMTVKAVAKKLGLPLGTVSTVHIRARQKLREIALASERATTFGGGTPR